MSDNTEEKATRGVQMAAGGVAFVAVCILYAAVAATTGWEMPGWLNFIIGIIIYLLLALWIDSIWAKKRNKLHETKPTPSPAPAPPPQPSHRDQEAADKALFEKIARRLGE